MMSVNDQLGGGPPPSWICCQIGAREHYAVPRALHRMGKLESMITDAWVPPGHPAGFWRRSLKERFHPELQNARVMAGTGSLAAFELRMKCQGLAGWWLTMARNEWFQTMALKRLRQLPDSSRPRVLFCYSYAARRLLIYARCRGWQTVLGQIDPGADAAHVEELCRKHGGAYEEHMAPPQAYLDSWRQECMLADRIVVNSEWSRQSLENSGVSGVKLEVIPLAFESGASGQAHREYPARFDEGRPMRVLFLSQVTLRKGIMPVLEAAKLLKGLPVEFWIVGAERCHIPAELRRQPGVCWVGRIDRAAASRFYEEADVFLFPSFSDGFGLTQLEAQAVRLPVIASRFCGNVVSDGVNGAILEEPSGEAIATVLKRCLEQPDMLKRWSAHAVALENFSLARFGERLAVLPPVERQSRGESKPGTSPVTAILTAYNRPEKTVRSIERLQACCPAPAEILVHVDAGRTGMTALLRQYFPSLRILESSEPLGPGGGRNRLLEAATHEWVASFDDDSYPQDSDYFRRVERLMRQHPEAAILSAIVFAPGEAVPLAEERARWTVDFAGGGCVYRKSIFQMTTGYVPLRHAFAMEEVDLAMRLHAMGARILECRQLRVFHDSDGSHRKNNAWVAGAVSNVALHAYLRYPPTRWPLGLLQTLWRSLELACSGHVKGVLQGWAKIPGQCQRHKAWRETVPWQLLRSYRRLRKHPLPAAAGA
jgi:glycosyltransferase involved in cell wall biosynthesis/GT2 family glycosyltransferase